MARKKIEPDDERDADWSVPVSIPDGEDALLGYIASVTAQESVRRGRGPQKAPTKQLVSLRLAADTLAAYRATGDGWQTRIADDLKLLSLYLGDSDEVTTRDDANARRATAFEKLRTADLERWKRMLSRMSADFAAEADTVVSVRAPAKRRRRSKAS